MTLFAWAKGREKGHAGILNAQWVHEGLKKGHVIYGQPLIADLKADFIIRKQIFKIRKQFLKNFSECIKYLFISEKCIC